MARRVANLPEKRIEPEIPTFVKFCVTLCGLTIKVSLPVYAADRSGVYIVVTWADVSDYWYVETGELGLPRYDGGNLVRDYKGDSYGLKQNAFEHAKANPLSRHPLHDLSDPRGEV